MPLLEGKPPDPPTNDLAYQASEKSRLGKVEEVGSFAFKQRLDTFQLSGKPLPLQKPSVWCSNALLMVGEYDQNLLILSVFYCWYSASIQQITIERLVQLFKKRTPKNCAL